MADDKRVVVSKDEYKKLREKGKTSWRTSIIDYLKSNQGVDEIQLVDNTHPTGLDSDKNPMSEAKKRNNFASVKTHLADDGYLIKAEDNKLFLLTEVVGKDIVIVKGQEDRYKRLA